MPRLSPSGTNPLRRFYLHARRFPPRRPCFPRRRFNDGSARAYACPRRPPTPPAFPTPPSACLRPLKRPPRRLHHGPRRHARPRLGVSAPPAPTRTAARPPTAPTHTARVSHADGSSTHAAPPPTPRTAHARPTPRHAALGSATHALPLAPTPRAHPPARTQADGLDPERGGEATAIRSSSYPPVTS